MAGGTFIKIAAGAGGAAAANVDYITREQAVKDREEGVLLQNMPEEVEQARGQGRYRELRGELHAYAEMRKGLFEFLLLLERAPRLRGDAPGRRARPARRPTRSGPDTLPGRGLVRARDRHRPRAGDDTPTPRRDDARGAGRGCRTPQHRRHARPRLDRRPADQRQEAPHQQARLSAVARDLEPDL